MGGLAFSEQGCMFESLEWRGAAEILSEVSEPKVPTSWSRDAQPRKPLYSIRKLDRQLPLGNGLPNQRNGCFG
jgi:hypothetical protein